MVEYQRHGIPGNIRFNPDNGKKKRKRKTKDEVERNFKCNLDSCGKSYGSENSLNQHMKLKHPDFWSRIKEKEQSLTKSGVQSIKNEFPAPNLNNMHKDDDDDDNCLNKREYDDDQSVSDSGSDSQSIKKEEFKKVKTENSNSNIKKEN